MRIVFDINHPAHVHFFKNLIWQIRQKGHQVLITASEKDVALHLLDCYQFEYVNLGSYGKSLLQKLVNVPVMDFKMYQAVRRFNPDILMGLGSIRAAHASKLLGKPCINFEEDEHSPEQHLLYYPFSDIVFTPSSFKLSLGQKQVRYNSFHELAYLHPNYYVPNPQVLKEMGLSEDDNIFLLRFGAKDATHDTRCKKFKKEYIEPLVKLLADKGRVIVSSEIELEDDLKQYQYRLGPEKYIDLLYYCKMYVGEGYTSAEEAAVMGVPALHFERLWINGRSSSVAPLIGVLSELQDKYQLLYSFCDEIELLKKVEELLGRIDLVKEEWSRKREALLKDKIDLTAFMVWMIENFPQSYYQLKYNQATAPLEC